MSGRTNVIACTFALLVLYSYETAMRFVDACEAGAASKSGVRQ